MYRRQFVKSAIAMTQLPLAYTSVDSRENVLSVMVSNRLNEIRNIVIYNDPSFYCIEPSILQRPDGELFVVFRRAPDRTVFGEKYRGGHIDGKSQLVMVRSKDNGKTWTNEPELIYAHPFGGTQGGSMIQCKDGSIVVNSYAWLPLRVKNLSSSPPKMTTRHNEYNFLGGYVLRSEDGGQSWEGPFNPTPMINQKAIDVFGNVIPMFNRGAMCEGKNGQIYWAARSCSDAMSTRHYELHLLKSTDGGKTWERHSRIAKETHVSFTETSLIETPKGDIVGFVRARKLKNKRSEGSKGTLQGIPLSDHISAIIRSKDGGRSFTWKNAGFFGYPHHLLQLPDGRVWLTYGYRKPPYGIRARMLNPECTNAAEAEEIILRDDGGSSDIGYPWSVLLSDGKILTVYWINIANSTRFIAGTIIG